MCWWVVLAALTLAGYFESIMIFSIAVEDTTYRDTQIPWPEPCYGRDSQMHSPCLKDPPIQERRCGQTGQRPW